MLTREKILEASFNKGDVHSNWLSALQLSFLLEKCSALKQESFIISHLINPFYLTKCSSSYPCQSFQMEAAAIFPILAPWLQELAHRATLGPLATIISSEINLQPKPD